MFLIERRSFPTTDAYNLSRNNEDGGQCDGTVASDARPEGSDIVIHSTPTTYMYNLLPQLLLLLLMYATRYQKHVTSSRFADDRRLGRKGIYYGAVPAVHARPLPILRPYFWTNFFLRSHSTRIILPILPRDADIAERERERERERKKKKEREREQMQ